MAAVAGAAGGIVAEAGHRETSFSTPGAEWREKAGSTARLCRLQTTPLCHAACREAAPQRPPTIQTPCSNTRARSGQFSSKLLQRWRASMAEKLASASVIGGGKTASMGFPELLPVNHSHQMITESTTSRRGLGSLVDFL